MSYGSQSGDHEERVRSVAKLLVPYTLVGKLPGLGPGLGFDHFKRLYNDTLVKLEQAGIERSVLESAKSLAITMGISTLQDGSREKYGPENMASMAFTQAEQAASELFGGSDAQIARDLGGISSDARRRVKEQLGSPW